MPGVEYKAYKSRIGISKKVSDLALAVLKLRRVIVISEAQAAALGDGTCLVQSGCFVFQVCACLAGRTAEDQMFGAERRTCLRHPRKQRFGRKVCFRVVLEQEDVDSEESQAAGGVSSSTYLMSSLAACHAASLVSRTMTCRRMPNRM